MSFPLIGHLAVEAYARGTWVICECVANPHGCYYGPRDDVRYTTRADAEAALELLPLPIPEDM